MLLHGCSSGEFEDLNRFVEESKQGLRGRVEPLPEIKQFEPFAYNAFELPDPFSPRASEADGGSPVNTGPAPDINRRAFATRLSGRRTTICTRPKSAITWVRILE
jgi:type IV pilus assembly protein PilP